jgi:hypothetical protein
VFAPAPAAAQNIFNARPVIEQLSRATGQDFNAGMPA